MENNSVEITDEIVTLVLGDSRIDANREKLANYSLYFASLFSENFKDHEQNEFRINYDISLATLKNFVNWINNEGEHTRVVHSPKYFFVVRASLEKFLSGHYSEFLELLELSVVFMAEKLTENIVEMIICMRLPPNNMLEIWLMAENLGLKVLRNVALAVCLDRFEELPVSLLVELPIENFLKLVLNVNVRSTTARLQVIREEWKKCNDVPKDLPDSYLQFLNGDPENVKTILDRKKPHYVQCVAGHKLNKSLGIWSWNGKILQELTEMTDSQMHTTFEDNGKEITGRQVVGRGFGIYLIGGEQGIGSGRFNTALWRYCPFSKKWYIETLLPRPRRHMAVAFIENKLYLFGGVGRHRLKLSSVDIFNVHTGIWSKGSDVPELFTDVPSSCVGNNKFVYYKSDYFIYDPFLDEWSSCILREPTHDDFDPIFSMQSATLDESTSSLLEIKKSNTCDRCMIQQAIVSRDGKNTFICEVYIDLYIKTASLLPPFHVWYPQDLPSVFDQQIFNGSNLVSFIHSEGRATIEVGEFKGYHFKESPEFFGNCSRSRPVHEWTRPYRRLKLYSKELNNAAADCFKHRLGCFNLIDPESLHNLINLPEQTSISV